MAFPAVNLVLLGEFGAVGHELAALAKAGRIIGGTRGRATRTFDRHLQPLTNPPAAAHPAQAVVLSQCREVSRSVRTCLNAPLAALNAVATDLSIAASSRVFVVTRMPFETEFIQHKLLATGALDALNEDARYVLYVVAETGMRPSEVVNLQEDAIRLDAKIPYVKVQPDGRRLKTEDSEREIPLVGVALAAMKLRPQGFPRYRDKSSSLSATVNKFLRVNGLRPTKDHSVYSLRHSFKDRLVAAEAPDSLIDSLMGHKTYKPKYGRGPSLELKLKYLQQIAFKPPALV